MTLKLNAEDTALLNGDAGEGTALAMRILAAYSEAIGAEAMLPISGAHIDGCLYHGAANVDFVERLLDGNARVRVPTTLNVGSLDLIHPEIMQISTDDASPHKRLMAAHEALGCLPSFTCAPYQTLFRPRFGDQVAWGESNAIVFANSVIGARTNRYGDFIDLCCAITGKAPAWGLHLDQNRRGQLLYTLKGFPASIEPTDALFTAVGLIVGKMSGERIPVIDGLPAPRDEDQLKALGAAAAASGAVGLFHIVGVTPEAPTIEAAFQGLPPEATFEITPADVETALRQLSTVPDGAPIVAVCLGTPHFSRPEWERLLSCLGDVRPGRGIPIYVNTGRATLEGLEKDGLLAGTDRFGLQPVADTCTYVTSILQDLTGVIMTNSGKWAYYAPGNLGCEVSFGTIEDCVQSAALGCVARGAI